MDVSKKTEETWDKTSFTRAPYQQPNSFSEMNGGDAGIYAVNWVQVFADQLSMWAPKHPVNNVFVMADWGYTDNKFYVPKLHLVNFTFSMARIVNVQVSSNPHPNPWDRVTSYGPSESVGRNGTNPGVIDFNLSSQGYSRDTSIFVTVWVKVAAAPLPIGSQIMIPGRGLQPGLSDPIPWYSNR
jgi:hypothetical protein